MAKKLEMGRATISIDVGHISILPVTLPCSFTHSLIQSSLLPHWLIQWEATLILLGHGCSEEASLDLSQTPSLSL